MQSGARLKKTVFVAAILLSAIGAVAYDAHRLGEALAQDAPAKDPKSVGQDEKPAPLARTVLQHADFPTEKYASISTMVVIQPGAVIARHSHPGIEIGYVVEGAIQLKIGDEAMRSLSAGASFLVPAGVAHGGKNGENVAKLVSTYVVERDKPLTSPAP